MSKSKGGILRPITSDEEHQAALAEVDRVWGAKKGTPESDFLDAIVTLIEAYEQKRWPMKQADPIAMIEFCLEQQGLTRKDLEPMIGSRTRVSEVLSGKRGLSLAMIRRLSAGLGIPADVLIQPTGPSKAA